MNEINDLLKTLPKDDLYRAAHVLAWFPDNEWNFGFAHWGEADVYIHYEYSDKSHVSLRNGVPYICVINYTNPDTAKAIIDARNSMKPWEFLQIVKSVIHEICT